MMLLLQNFTKGRGFKTDSLTHQGFKMDADKVVSALDLIIRTNEANMAQDQMNYSTQQAPQQAAPAAAGELIKYKQSLDIGAISEEEFNRKKIELLGL